MIKELTKFDQMFMTHLNNNPVPLEFTNGLSTTEWLGAIYSMLKEVADGNENIYSELEKRFTTEFEKLSSDINEQLTTEKFLERYTDVIQKICLDFATLDDYLAYVTFGLDDEGYFYADVPDSLSSITFSTCYDDENYGKLQIEY